MLELDRAVVEARTDLTTHALVIMLSCSGGDMCASRRENAVLDKTLSNITGMPKLCIFALSGDCSQAGFALALACDLRIAHAGAGKMDVGAPARPVEFDVAHRKGLVNELWRAQTRNEFADRLFTYARSLAVTPKAAPLEKQAFVH